MRSTNSTNYVALAYAFKNSQLSHDTANNIIRGGMYFFKLFSILASSLILIYCCAQVESQVSWSNDTSLKDEDVLENALETTSYIVHLSLKSAQTSYEGAVTIELKLREGILHRLIERIVMHADSSLDIGFIECRFEKNGVEIDQFSRNESRQLIALKFKQAIDFSSTRYLGIMLSFTKNTIDKSGHDGLYWVRYKSGDEMKAFGVIDMTGLRVPRLVFPCFDHNSFKAEISFSVTHDLIDATIVDEPSQASQAPQASQSSTSAAINPAGSEFISTSKIPLRSVAFVIGSLRRIEDEDAFSIHSLEEDSTSESSLTNTLSIWNRLHEVLKLYLQTQEDIKKYGIIILPMLSCSCGTCTDDGHNRVVNAWGQVLGTRDLLLVHEQMPNSVDKSSRIINLARALVNQYLISTFGSLNGGANDAGGLQWHIEAAAAHMSAKIAQLAFKFDYDDYYLNGQFRSKILDLDTFKEVKLKDEQCRSRQVSDIRFYKSFAVWSDLARMIVKEFNEPLNLSQLFHSLIAEQKHNPLVDPEIQITQYLRRILGRPDYYVYEKLRRMLYWRASIPTYDIITLVERPSTRRILIRVGLAMGERVGDQVNLKKRKRLYHGSAAIFDGPIFVQFEIIFKDRLDSHYEVVHEVVCDGMTLKGRACLSMIPNWFDFEDSNHFLYVKAETPRYQRFAYSDFLLSRLTRNLSSVTPLNHLQLVEDMHGLAKLKLDWLMQLSSLVAGTVQHERRITLLEAYARIRTSLHQNALFGGYRAEIRSEDFMINLGLNLDALTKLLLEVTQLGFPVQPSDSS